MAAQQLGQQQLGKVPELLSRDDTDGLLILHKGQVVFEYRHDSFGPRQTHVLNSASKVFTGCVAAILAEQGKLDWHSPLDEVLPELKGTGYEGVSMQTALDMASGIELAPDAEFKALGSHPNQGDTPAIGVVGLTLSVRKGAGKAKYGPRCTDTDVVGMACEKVAGKAMHELISEHIWQPIGARDNADMALDMFRTPIYNGGVIATLQDLGLFVQVLLDEGRAGNQQVIPPDYVKQSSTSTAELRESMNGNFYGFPWPGAAFHNTFFLDPERRANYNYGAFGNLLFVDWDNQAACVLLSAWEKPNEQIMEWIATLRDVTAALR
jgi:CubicO group peptidase (beta-lactamase class C family)